MRSIQLVLALGCAAVLAQACTIDRTPPRVVQTSEPIAAAADEPRDHRRSAARFESYTQAVREDAGVIADQAFAGSQAQPPTDTDDDAGAGCDPDAR